MAVARKYTELIAWQLADEFKKEVFEILKSSDAAWRSVRYREHVVDEASAVPANIAEGFLRHAPAQFCQFLDYAIASIGEAENRLADGIDLGFFDRPRCEAAFKLARRCLTASVRLKQSQKRYIQRQRRKSRQKRNDEPR